MTAEDFEAFAFIIQDGLFAIAEAIKSLEDGETAEATDRLTEAKAPEANDLRQKVWLSRSEAAEYLGVNLRWLRRAMEAGLITGHRRNRLVIFDRSELDSYIESARGAYMAAAPTGAAAGRRP